MTKDDIDQMWNQAMNEAVKNGENFTRYRFAVLVAEHEREGRPWQGPVSHSVIAGALFDFLGWLTSRKERLALSRVDDASPAVEAITAFSKMRGLSLDDARVQDWHTTPPAAQRQGVGLTDEDKLTAVWTDALWAQAILKERNI